MSIAARHEEQQKKTFTRWCKLYLADHERDIESLADLHNGVNLFFILKSLHDRNGQEFPIFRKMETRRVHMHFVQKTNVQTVLNYLGEKGVVLHGINSLDIVNKDLKIIMGLIWAIIGKFLVGDDEEAARAGKRAQSPYNVMVRWVNERIKVENVQVTRLSDWEDGRALAALAKVCSRSVSQKAERDSFVSGCAGKSGRDLLLHTFAFSSDIMKIPEVCSVDEFVHPEKMSITTYLSYYKAFWNLMNEDAAVYQEQIQSLEDKVAEYAKTVTERDERLEQLEALVKKQKSELEDWNRNAGQHAQLIKSLQDEAANLKERIEFLLEALQQAKQEQKDLEEEIEEMDEEISSNDQKFHVQTKTLRETESELRQKLTALEFAFIYIEKATGRPYPGQETRLGEGEREAVLAKVEAAGGFETLGEGEDE